MTVHVEEMVSEVTVVQGDLPLTEAQLEKVVDAVIARLEQRKRDRALARTATQLRPSSLPPSPGGEVG
jgi:hypothetical protein